MDRPRDDYLTWASSRLPWPSCRARPSFYIPALSSGAAEAGFFPGIILYLSHYFEVPKRRRQCQSCSWWRRRFDRARLPLSSALLEMDGIMACAAGNGCSCWKPFRPSFFGFVVLAYMYRTSLRMKWLKDDERAIFVGNDERRTCDWRGDGEVIPSGRVSTWRAGAGARLFRTSAGLYTLGVWHRKIIKGASVCPTCRSAFNAVPPTIAVIAMCICVVGIRIGPTSAPWCRVIACVAAAVALAGGLPAAWSRSLPLVLVNHGISAAKPPLWSMPTLFLSGPVAAGIATIN